MKRFLAAIAPSRSAIKLSCDRIRAARSSSMVLRSSTCISARWRLGLDLVKRHQQLEVGTQEQFRSSGFEWHDAEPKVVVKLIVSASELRPRAGSPQTYSRTRVDVVEERDCVITRGREPRGEVVFERLVGVETLDVQQADRAG